MSQESVVYGCITDMPLLQDEGERDTHRQTNRDSLMSLPSVEDWPLISREMFAMPAQNLDETSHTDVVHFGSSYKGVEYEWQQWIATFEELLKGMYWVSATVHLETAYKGTHTFTWEAEDTVHEPSDAPLSVRCEWSREAI